MEAMKATTTNTAIEFWISAVKEQAASGLTVADYCQLIEKSTFQFYYWKRRVGNGATKAFGRTESETGGFIEVQYRRTDSRSRDEPLDFVDIQIGLFSIRFTAHTERALFKAAASALLEIAG